MSGTQFAMVSRWMPNGNINEFLEVRRDANRFELVSAQLMFLPHSFLANDRAIWQLADVAEGLVYMHEQGMFHGDLKGVCSQASILPHVSNVSLKANILIDETHRARLADFGLLTIISESTSLSVSSSSFTQGGTHRWMSPELFLPQRFGIKDGRPTKQSDCYALGMVVYEVLRGEVPFHRDGGYIVIAKVIDGHRPGRPRGREGTWFTDDIWSVLRQCWKPKPGDRPSVPEVLRSLKTWIPPSPQSSALADLATTKALMWNSDSNTEEDMDESKASSPSHAAPFRPLQGDI